MTTMFIFTVRNQTVEFSTLEKVEIEGLTGVTDRQDRISG